MRILIIGGCGFLGSNLAYEFIKDKSGELFILDNLYRPGSRKNSAWLTGCGKFKFYNLDIRGKDKISQVIRRVKPEVIFHLAGQVAMITSINDLRFDFEINALGTFIVLDTVRKHTLAAILVYSSTKKVYGDLEWVKYRQLEKRYVAEDFLNGFTEDIPLDFSSPYGCSKGAADQYVLDFARSYGLKTVVFRHSSLYDGRQFSTYE